MEPLDIEGVKVLFPYKPYDLQLDYMKCVIKCLKEKTNGLLESPTGTGKTLCILCSTLGWLDYERIKQFSQLSDKKKEKIISIPKSLPQILYSSRTHSQLSQACKELKRTSYNTFKAVVIGSRDQLCLDSDVSNLETISAKNQMCRHKIASNSCAYYRNYEQKVERNEDYNSTQVFDIEDLVKLGRKNTCCPYYASRVIRSKASLVFTPYNYVLDPTIRSTNSLELKNSVIIFDEGHNIERMCEESVSTELRSETFAICIKHIDLVLNTLKEINDGSYTGYDAKEYSELNLEKVAKLKLMVCDLEMAIDSMIKSKGGVKSLHETKVIFDIMDTIGLEVEACNEWIDIIDKISMILTNGSTLNASQSTITSAAFTCLSTFIQKLVPIKVISQENYESYKIDFIKKFKIFSQRGNETNEDQSKGFWTKKSDPNAWVLYIWCLSPSFGAKALLESGIHSMIITSGTLAPITSFEVEMEFKFPIKLQNNHIIGDNQLSILNICNARDNTVLTSKYDNRDNLHYYRALGYTLMELLRSVPKGVLVFFSSYTALNKCITIWKQSENIWTKVNDVKQIFLEPRSKKTFNECIAKYKLKIDEPNSSGAVFFGVCRGKLSEGIDLPDDYCRCVVMTGLPFPSVADPRVMLKKQYLNEAKTSLSADGWYALQMKRALNQSIGRVVRHKDDYGVIILLDSRFASLSDGLSKWIEKFIYKSRANSFDDSIKKLKTFFTSNITKNDTNYVKTAINRNVLFEKTLTTTTTSRRITPQSSNQFNNFINCSQNSKPKESIEENMNSLIPLSKSIFDCFSSTVRSSDLNTENIEKTSYESKQIIEILDESPLKKLKPNVEMNSTTPSTDAKPKPKLNSIIKNKTNSEPNSSKKVHWNEDNNRVHTFKSIAFDSVEETTVSEEKDKTIQKNIEVIKPPNNDKLSREEMLDFWRKSGAELKDMFVGTNKFNQLCQAIKTYKKYKNLRLLSITFKGLFDKCDKEKRNRFIRELSVIVPKSEYHVFLNYCDIELSDKDLAKNKEFVSIQRESVCESNH